MQLENPMIEGRLVRRYKRFLADVELEDGSVITAHCPNTGSLLGCKEPGSRVVLRDSQNPKRKYIYVFQTIEVNGTLVNVDTGLPNAAVFEAIEQGEIPELTGYDLHKREVKYGTNSRIDVYMEKASGEKCYVEVKSTTLVRGETALFPDAVTERGLKHLGELSRAVEAGDRAVQFFFVGRSDAVEFRPAEDIDPKYTAGLRQAAEAGVEILAYTADVQPSSIRVERRIPVNLSPSA